VERPNEPLLWLPPSMKGVSAEIGHVAALGQLVEILRIGGQLGAEEVVVGLGETCAFGGAANRDALQSVDLLRRHAQVVPQLLQASLEQIGGDGLVLQRKAAGREVLRQLLNGLFRDAGLAGCGYLGVYLLHAADAVLPRNEVLEHLRGFLIGGGLASRCESGRLRRSADESGLGSGSDRSFFGCRGLGGWRGATNDLNARC